MINKDGECLIYPTPGTYEVRLYEEAEKTVKHLGLSMRDAINLFLTLTVHKGKLPFAESDPDYYIGRPVETDELNQMDIFDFLESDVFDKDIF